MIVHFTLFVKDDKPRSPTLRLEGEETKPDHDKEREQIRESKDSRESLRDRSSTNSLKIKEREKSAKSDRGEKDKLPKSAESKSRSGSKLSVIDKPERNKSGGLSPKGRRMSRMEKPGDFTKSKKLHYFEVCTRVVFLCAGFGRVSYMYIGTNKKTETFKENVYVHIRMA